jgi:hypothetical protein
MGFLSNLIGGKKDSEFAPTSDTMSDDQFWKLINLTYEKSKGDFETQQQILHQELRKLRPVEVIHFDNKFRKLRGDAYTWDLWGAISIVHSGCGDDSFMDFRDWVIAQGKDFYYRTLSNPESLVDVDSERIDVDWEGMGYIPNTVFKEITGVKMPSVQVENNEIKGEEWNESNDDLKNRFPLLWAKYS